ncbi:MAG: hypothetical protein IPL78_10520 [Chloroflexi bacterium]|nr:hypothetical protein [Chloroflexota bacterium]
MALTTAATEPHRTTNAFSRQMMKLNTISRAAALDDVVKATNGLPFAGTDCALPMLWAIENKVSVEAFIVYTDSETI